MSEWNAGPGPGENEMDHHVWLAGRHIDSAQGLAERPSDVEDLNEAAAVLKRVGTRDVVAVEFTKEQAELLLHRAHHAAVPLSMAPKNLQVAYHKLYNALAVELGGGEHLPAYLRPVWS